MAYKQMASEGSFSGFQLKAPDEVAKQQRETQRQVSALKENATIEARNREIYLRAQEFAQGVELDSMERNFDFETENRQEFIDRKKENMQTLLAENERKGQERAELYKSLGGLAKGALETYNVIQEQNKQNRMNAASAEIATTGITMKQMQLLTGLDRNLTQAALLESEKVQAIIGSDAPDEVKQALFNIYRNSGSYEYVNNKTLIQNTAYAYSSAVSDFNDNYLQENPDSTVEERLEAYRDFDRDWRVQSSSINGRRIRHEMLAANRDPVINRERTRVEARFQAERAENTKEQIENDRQVHLGTIWQSDGGRNFAGLESYLKDTRSAAARSGLTTWAINSAKSTADGSMTVDDLQTLLNLRMTGMPGNPRFEDQFPEEAAQVTAAIRQIKNQNRTDSNNRLRDQQELQEFEVREMIASFYQDAETPGILTKQELEKAEILAQQLDPSREFRVITQAKKMTRYAQAKEEVDETLTKLRSQGNLTTERVLEMNLPEEIETFWLSQAKQITDFRNGPKAQQFDREILTLLKSPTQIKVNPNGDAKNVSVLTMAGHYTRLRNTRYATLISEGMSPTAAADAATAETLTKVREMIAADGSIDSASGYTGAAKIDQNRKDEAKALLNRTAAVREFRSLPATDQHPQDIVAALDQNKYKAYIAQMQSGSPIPQEVRAHAEIMRLTPLEWVNYIAPALQVEPITLPDELKDWETYLNEVEPETRALFTLNPTDERIKRAIAIKASNEGNPQPQPVRDAFLTYEGNERSYIDAGNAFQGSDGEGPAGFRVREHVDFGGVAPGVHSADGFHPFNEAFDITHWTNADGSDPGRAESIRRTGVLKDYMRSIGAFKEILGPASPNSPADRNHESHLHVGGLIRPLTPEEVATIQRIAEGSSY